MPSTVGKSENTLHRMKNPQKYNHPKRRDLPIGVSQSKPHSENESILIIEDEEMLLQLEQTIFERLGYTIFAAENGIEGCKIFEKNHSEIDLVILDINMPKMDGAEALERIKQTKHSIKVILISGNELPKAIVEFFGATSHVAFIQKPFEIPQLTEMVRDLLDGKSI